MVVKFQLSEVMARGLAATGRRLLFKTIAGLLVCCFSTLMLAMSGCSGSAGQEVDVRYGKSVRAVSSINGTSLLVAKLREQGHSVKVKNRISPSIKQYDVIIWAPDSNIPPSPEAVTALEQWISGDYYSSGKTLIYIGGNYSAEYDYLRSIAAACEGKEREEILRRIAEKRIEESGEVFYPWMDARDECQWFEVDDHSETTSSILEGPLVAAIEDSELPELKYSRLFKPEEKYTTFGEYGSRYDWETNSLLTIDGNPFVTELSSSDFSENRIILVANASFLINFALVDPAKEKIADRLLAELPGYSDVLVLESGPSDIEVSDSEYENRNSWAWISEAPLRYIVPHFLFWGVMFCFVSFPIFGRPRRTETASTTSFRNHVNAVAKQMKRSGRMAKALEAIRNYQEMADDKGKRKKE